MSGTKHDAGKAPIGLIPYESLIGTAEVLAFGAKKYAAHNWRGGFEWQRLIDAALRHLLAFNAGQDTDPESGLSHADHAACCIAFLQAHIKSGLGTDNRFVLPSMRPAPVLAPAAKLDPDRPFQKGDRVKVKEGRALSEASRIFDLDPLQVYIVESAPGPFGASLTLVGKTDVTGYKVDRFAHCDD